MGGYSLSGNWDRGTPELILCEEDCLCLTDFRPIHIPAMRTKGIPIPNPTPRPTLTVAVLELGLAGDVGALSEPLWGDVEVDDVKAVDELELDEMKLDEVELDELELDEL